MLAFIYNVMNSKYVIVIYYVVIVTKDIIDTKLNNSFRSIV